MLSSSKAVGRSGIEALYYKEYKVKEIAEIYDISGSYLYNCLRQLYGRKWKSMLSKRAMKEENFYDKQRICIID